jgi:phosphoribosylglycinamide formyltransferase 1
MKQMVILISGRGSNMQALLSAAAAQAWPVQVTVISNRPDAQGLGIAKAHGAATLVIDHTTFADRQAFDRALAQAIDPIGPDLIVLAGFMRILSAEFCQRFQGRLINIHPSLLPAFTGLHTHERALAEGVRLHGCTVHQVTPELDHGPILGQAVVPVLANDTPQTLAARVLEMEHQLYPLTVYAVLFDQPNLKPCLVHPLLRQDSPGLPNLNT